MGARGSGWRIAIVVVALIAVPARADADCASDADRLRAHLVEAADRTHKWNLSWTLVYGTVAAFQFTLGVTQSNPFGDSDTAFRDAMLVGGVKASLGFAVRVIDPLHVDVPPADPDRCVELAALRKSLTRIANKERNSFWLSHLGGTAVNLAGAAILWYRHSLNVGALSFATSYPSGPMAAYTLPRASWHLWREEKHTWSVVVVPHTELTMIVIGRAF